MKPEELEALADRIDHEELWRRPGMERDQMTPEQRDRLDAGVNLRRYADQRGGVVRELKKGAEYIRGFKLERADNLSTDRRGCGTNEWHGALNAYADEMRRAGKGWPRFMYTAKMISDEVPRMILLFEQDRRGRLPGSFKMCAHDPAPATPLPDNHLRCSLGVECRKCPHLAGIDASARMTSEAKDEAKAWTCATHILAERGDTYLEQCLYDKSDDAFNERLISSLAAEQDQRG